MAFSDGLRDSETKQAQILARPDRLVDALACTLDLEAIKKSCWTLAGVRLEDQLDEPSLEETLRWLFSETLFKKMEIRSWNCGEQGHFSGRWMEKKEMKPQPESKK